MPDFLPLLGLVRQAGLERFCRVFYWTNTTLQAENTSCTVRYPGFGQAEPIRPLRYPVIHVGSTGIENAPATSRFFMLLESRCSSISCRSNLVRYAGYLGESETRARPCRVIFFAFQGTGRNEDCCKRCSWHVLLSNPPASPKTPQIKRCKTW
jgi:hypothetical protein